MRPRLRSRALALVALALPGLLSGAQLTLNPTVIEAGKPATVTLHGWAPGMQLALVPDGPFASHRLALADAPRAVAGAGRLAYVAGAGGVLRVIEFPEQGAARIAGEFRTARGDITALLPVRNHLLATVAGFGLLAVDVSDPAAPRELGRYSTPQPVRDVFVAGDDAYLLVGERELVRLDLRDAARPTPLGRWILPLPAHALVVHDAQAVTAGPEGVALLQLDRAGARLLDRHRTSGQARALALHGERLLVDDGPGGLLVLELAEGRLRWVGSHRKRGPIDAMTAAGERAWVLLDGHTLLSLGVENPRLPRAGAAYYSVEPVRAVASAGDAVLVATEVGVARIDFGTESRVAPGQASGLSPEGVNWGGSRRGVIRDDILYVADWFSGLHLYDIREPAHPRHLGNYHTPGSSKGVALKDHYALVGDDDQGLQIIDVSDPRSPRWVSEVAPAEMATLGLAYTLKLVGERLYLADHRGGFHIIDLRDIRHPRRLGGYDTAGKSWAIDVVGDIAYVADDSAGLLMFDVADPARPVPLGAFNPGGTAEDVVVRDGLAYVAFFDGGFYILDITDPRRPRELGHVAIPGNARGIQLVGELAYVAGWESGLQVVDISRKDAPRIVGAFDTPGAAWGVNVAGNVAYVLDWWGGIAVLDVSEPARPRPLGRYHGQGTLHGLRAAGNYLFAASGAGGLQVFDIKNPLNPIWVTGVDLPGEAVDVWSEDDRVYVATGDGGVAVLDALDPFYTRQLGRLDTPGAATRVRARNDYLYIADSRAGLLLADAREPRQPRVVDRYPYRPNDLWLDAAGLYLAGADGVTLFAIGEGGRLAPLARAAIDGGVLLLRAQGELLAVVTAAGEVRLLRCGADGFATEGRFALGETVRDLQFDGDRLYLVGAHSGLLALDVSSPSRPVLTTRYPAAGDHTRLAIAQGAAFLGGETRLMSVTLLPPVTLDTATAPPTLRLPAGLPVGRYRLLAVDADGERRLQPTVIEARPVAPNKSGFNLEAIRRLLKQPLKPPPGP